MKPVYKKLFIAFLAVVSASCGYVPVRNPTSLTGGIYSFGESGKEIRLLSWNIEKKSGQIKWNSEFKRILDVKRPNIVLLQEAQLTPGASAFLSRQKIGGEFSPNTFSTQVEAYAGVLTASTIQPVKSASLLSDSIEPFTGTPKASLITVYKIKDYKDTLMVINVHGINFQLGLGAFTEQLNLLSDEIDRHPGPIILAGDFNTWNEKRLQHLTALTAPRFNKASFGTDSSQIKSMFGYTLDHIYFTRQHFVVLS
jgi:endonuclease/exonuclease/phosphatase (EEP) superfamily protein YafD